MGDKTGFVRPGHKSPCYYSAGNLDKSIMGNINGKPVKHCRAQETEEMDTSSKFTARCFL